MLPSRLQNVDLTEEDCIRALYSARWPAGFICPRCAHHQAYRIASRKLPLYECKSCRAQTSLISGTIMEGSRTPLSSWFKAIRMHASAEGINARQLSDLIGVTYKTAWLICHKLRHAMSRADAKRLLSGVVRVTHSVYCRRITASLKWQPQEQPLLIGASEDRKGAIKQIKLSKKNKLHLPHPYASPNPESFILHNVSPESRADVIFTKRVGQHRNRSLIQIGYEAEKFLARIFGGIGPKHLQVYLDQFAYGWNRKHENRYNALLADCAGTPTITYRMLVGSRTSVPSRRTRTRTPSFQAAG